MASVVFRPSSGPGRLHQLCRPGHHLCQQRDEPARHRDLRLRLRLHAGLLLQAPAHAHLQHRPRSAHLQPQGATGAPPSSSSPLPQIIVLAQRRPGAGDTADSADRACANMSESCQFTVQVTFVCLYQPCALCCDAGCKEAIENKQTRRAQCNICCPPSIPVPGRFAAVRVHSQLCCSRAPL